MEGSRQVLHAVGNSGLAEPLRKALTHCSVAVYWVYCNGNWISSVELLHIQLVQGI